MAGINSFRAQLNSGFSIPLIGFGTWKSKAGEVEASVYEAIKVGYRHIDAAWIYKNQDEVGRGIQRAISESLVSRDDLFVTSKLWNTFHGASDVVEQHLRETLAQLGLDYLDLYLIHWPSPSVPIEATWKSLERLVDLKLVRSIGVSNFSVSKVAALLSIPGLKHRPAVNQVEVHPQWRQEELLAAMRQEGIHLSAYSPLGSPDSSDMLKHSGKALLEHPVVLKVSAETGRSPGQVLLRWGLQRGYSILPKSVTPSRIASNFDITEWELSEDQFQQLSTIEPQTRLIHGNFFVKPNGEFPTLEALWG